MWEAVGIPDAEAQVYEALIPRGHSTAGDLAERAGFSTARTSKALARLTKRGLVSRRPGRPARFSALEPSLAGSVLISKREQELEQLQRHLNRLDDTFQTLASNNHPGEHLETIEGATAIWRAFVRVQRSAQSEVRAFDKPPYFVPPGQHGNQGSNLDELQLLEEQKVAVRVVYDQESLAIPGRMDDVWTGIHRGERARVATALPVKLVLSDRKMAIMSSPSDFEDGVAYLVRPSSILDVLSELFEGRWDRAIPLTEPEAGAAEAQTGSVDRQILGLLASGATDGTIARNFGWSIRTVQRNIHRLMDELGTTTRFQTGMEAARRGWL
jgi:DNA-binding CsgD family transcriptional regulator